MLARISVEYSGVLCRSDYRDPAACDSSCLCLWMGQASPEGGFVLWNFSVSLASDQSDLFPGSSRKMPPYSIIFVLYSRLSAAGSDVVVWNRAADCRKQRSKPSAEIIAASVLLHRPKW